MFLVHHNQPEVAKRSKNSGARSDHESHIPASGLLPFLEPLAIGEFGMQNTEPAAKRLLGPVRDQRQKRNFRDEDQYRLARSNDLLREPEVDLGLSASGNTMKQENAEGSDRFANSRESVLLAAIEAIDGFERRPEAFGGGGHPEAAQFAALSHLPHKRCGILELLPQVLDRNGGRLLTNIFVDGALLVVRGRL